MLATKPKPAPGLLRNEATLRLGGRGAVPNPEFASGYYKFKTRRTIARNRHSLTIATCVFNEQHSYSPVLLGFRSSNPKDSSTFEGAVRGALYRHSLSN